MKIISKKSFKTGNDEPAVMYKSFIGICMSIMHEKIINYNTSKTILMFGIGDIGFWFGTPHTQIHIFYSK